MDDASDSTATPRRRATDRAAEPGVALVPVAGICAAQDHVIDAVPLRSARHDPSFLTHLIAMAERCPQTRVLRRATPEDAMAAYRAADTKGHVARVGIVTRHDI